MLPNFLFPEQTATANGAGPAIEIGDSAGGVLQVTLGITDVVEQESLDVSIWGSADGLDFGLKPIAAFPQKFYAGVYTVLLDLQKVPDFRFLQVHWKMHRWGHWGATPKFTFYVFGELLKDAA
ncbi:MAG TPA: hypothetical protein VMZ52_21060 [Bryobacteraceae bacterium]|nr:hypothetical protein [Bryobacteraceae bacterium]